jgi:DedD protein
MARPISDEELQLKKRARRRLVGAIVLVTAVAVILPMVLDSEPRPVSQNVNIQIPSPDAGEYKPKAITPAPSAGKQAKAVDSKAKGDTAAPAAAARADSAAVRTITEPAPPAATKPEPPAAAKADSGKAPASSGFVVQVAALADAAKAKQLEKQMAGAGVKTYTEVITTQSGEVTRVRAGPYPTREAAEKARTQLKKAGLDGKVVPK